MGAKQWVRALLLFLLFGPCVFYNHHTTQSSHDHCKHNRHHTISLIVRVSQINQEQTARRRGNPSLPYHTFFMFLCDQGHQSASMGLLQGF